MSHCTCASESLLIRYRKVFTPTLGPQSLHSGKGSGFFDKAVMATRLVPTHKASGTLGEWS